MLTFKVPNFGPQKVPILYTSPKFHPYSEMPSKVPNSKFWITSTVKDVKLWSKIPFWDHGPYFPTHCPSLIIHWFDPLEMTILTAPSLIIHCFDPLHLKLDSNNLPLDLGGLVSILKSFNLCLSRSVHFSISVFLNLCDSQLVLFSISVFLN